MKKDQRTLPLTLLLCNSCMNVAFQSSFRLHTCSRCKTVVQFEPNDGPEEVKDTGLFGISGKFPPNAPKKMDYDTIVAEKFPGAIRNQELVERVANALEDRDFLKESTLLATSFCCDELARGLEEDFVKVYGNNFNFGGLSGFPFGGKTGFSVMAGHIPDDGSCLIVYGPHVGISKSGIVGKVERKGVESLDDGCRSAMMASNYLKGITDGGATMQSSYQDFADFQQATVHQLLLPYGQRLSKAKDRMLTLPYALYDSQDALMQDIVKKGAYGLNEKGAALLGGIQINTAPGSSDYFLPLRFDRVDEDGEVVEDMLDSLISLWG